MICPTCKSQMSQYDRHDITTPYPGWSCPFCNPFHSDCMEVKAVESIVLTDSLISTLPASTSPCQYPSCNNQIPAGSQFKYCEVCRTLSVRNAIAITCDPFSPITERRDPIFHNAICNMRPEEIISACERVEYAYLQFKKTIYAQGLNLKGTPKYFESLEQEAIETRKKHLTPKTENKYEKKATKRVDKMTKLVGDSDEAKAWIKENLDF